MIPCLWTFLSDHFKQPALNLSFVYFWNYDFSHCVAELSRSLYMGTCLLNSKWEGLLLPFNELHFILFLLQFHNMILSLPFLVAWIWYKTHCFYLFMAIEISFSLSFLLELLFGLQCHAPIQWFTLIHSFFFFIQLRPFLFFTPKVVHPVLFCCKYCILAGFYQVMHVLCIVLNGTMIGIGFDIRWFYLFLKYDRIWFSLI